MPIPNIAVVGVGNFGTRHVKAAYENPAAHLIALCDQDSASLAAAAARYPAPHTFTDFDRLLALPGLDGVIIATPEATHCSLAQKAVAHGKHVLVEKPVSLSLDEARQLAGLAASTSVHILPGHILRHEASHNQTRALIASGEAGSIQSIRVKRNIPAENLGWHARTHPALMSLAHDMDIIVWLTGAKARRASAVARKTRPDLPHPDILFALAEMTNGVVCSLESQWRLPASFGRHIDTDLEIMTDKGLIRLQYPGVSMETLLDDRLVHHDATLWPEINGHTGGALAAEHRHFADLITGAETTPAVTVAEAVAGLEMAFMIIDAAETGRTLEA